MRGMGLPVLAAVAALGIVGTAAAAEGTAAFTIGTVKLTMPVPDGFCVPTGANADLAASTAEADRYGATLATFLACNRKPGIHPWSQYVLIKTPLGYQDRLFEKEPVLARMDAEGRGPNTPRLTEEMTEELAEQTENALGERIEMRGSYGYAGRDADCAYLAGPMQMTLRGQTLTARVASCVTIVGGKAVSVNIYDFRLAYTVQQLTARTKAIALSIRP